MKLLRLLLVPVALLCIPFVRLFKVRIGVLMSNRIGHLAGNTEVYLCEGAGRDIWASVVEPANAYLLKMWSRVLRIDRTGFAVIVLKVNRLFEGWQKHEIPPGNLDRDVNNLLEKQPPHIELTVGEVVDGQNRLRRWGLPFNARWVCLIVRDGSYLPELSYHSYRDSNIEDYEPAIRELVNRGYFVFRMGAKVDKPLTFKHPMVFDYATNGMRSEFMDIYLGANCEFCVSTGTGFDAIPYIFRRPICYVNYVPVEYLFTFVPGLAIWKHHIKDGKRMSFAEIFKSGAGQFMSAQEFSDAGITLEDNSPEEIQQVVSEMAGVWSRESQAEFWDAFPRSVSQYTQKPLHGAIRQRIGQKFLEAYRGT